MDFYEFEEQNPAYDNRKGEIDYQEEYRKLYNEVYNLGCFVDDLRQESNNGLIILIGNKLNEIINNR